MSQIEKITIGNFRLQFIAEKKSPSAGSPVVRYEAQCIIELLTEGKESYSFFVKGKEMLDSNFSHSFRRHLFYSRTKRTFIPEIGASHLAIIFSHVRAQPRLPFYVLDLSKVELFY